MSDLFVRINKKLEVYEVNVLNSTDDELVAVSDETGIGLSLDEMKRVCNYFHKIGRNPTDIELQALGQAWSEHCSYKSSKKILKKFVFGVDAPQNISVIKEDAGVVEFDKDHAYVVGFESHNHPSAVEPYGGAATGVGGILRDIVCMGAQPIGVLDSLFFAPLDYSKAIPHGTKHSKFLYFEVISGIRDYGNQVGIANVGGMVYFDDSYLTNCLVNVGCIGFMKKDDLIHSYAGGVGDLYVLLGGKTGRDGIHGVTFASVELSENSETASRSAVQVGQPIIKEPLIHVCLEANRKGLLTGMKDLGGGGLSCVVGEMAQPVGLGAHIDLEKVPLKEEGMAPWEIWVSESQERMMVTVKPEVLQQLLDLCNVWDIEVSIIGEVIEGKNLFIDYDGMNIFDMNIDFLVDAPMYERPIQVPEVDESEPDVSEPEDYNKMLLDLLSSLNITSKEDIVRGYDHEIMASSVVKSLVGKINRTTHGDAVVLKPLTDSYRGLAVTSDVNPRMVQANPYFGSASAMDEACRNLAAVGARVHSFADNLNFGNAEKPDSLGVFYESARGLGYVAKGLGVPFVSGNVSLYNEGVEGSILPTPAILAIGIVEDIRNTCTAELKKEGNRLYVVGETKKELGGSEYYRLHGVCGGVVPRVDIDVLRRSCEAVVSSIEKGAIAACHDVSDGGLLVALAEMIIGADGLGADADISRMEDLRSDFKLFSESNSRFIAEVSDTQTFEEIMSRNKVSFYPIGNVTSNGNLVVSDGEKELIDADSSVISRTWDEGIRNIVG
jgi:phosphoribosylformylglycinamidine synthase II